MINYKKFVENSRKWLSNYIKDNHLQSIYQNTEYKRKELPIKSTKEELGL